MSEHELAGRWGAWCHEQRIPNEIGLRGLKIIERDGAAQWENKSFWKLYAATGATLPIDKGE